MTSNKGEGIDRYVFLADRAADMLRAAVAEDLDNDIDSVLLQERGFTGEHWVSDLIQIQVSKPDTVAAWASTFGGRVRLRQHNDKDTYTSVRAIIETVNVTVDVWTHISPEAAVVDFCAGHGISVEDATAGTDIEPAWLLDFGGTEQPAAAA